MKHNQIRLPVIRSWLTHDALIAASDRFWSYVVKPDDQPCYGWGGARSKRSDGSLSYGVIGIGRKHRILAHRFSWMLVHGVIASNVVVCHRCDNVACTRIEHLFVGTQADNLADMRAKGRGYFNKFKSGTAHPNAKITPEIAAHIRDLRAGGATFKALAEKFGLHPATVHDIATSKTWRAA